VERIRIRTWCHMCFVLILVICIEITGWKEGEGISLPTNCYAVNNFTIQRAVQ
jgi:hypothetical protein